jgi:hypothetical protein
MQGRATDARAFGDLRGAEPPPKPRQSQVFAQVREQPIMSGQKNARIFSHNG